MSSESAPPCVRWFLDLTKWVPSTEERDFLINLFPRQLANSIRNCSSDSEKKRTLVHQMLQRAAITAALGIQWQHIKVGQSDGQRPFLQTPHSVPGADNFQFAVVDKGDIVLVATENSGAVDVGNISAAESGLTEKVMRDLVPEVAMMGYDILIEEQSQR